MQEFQALFAVHLHELHNAGLGSPLAWQGSIFRGSIVVRSQALEKMPQVQIHLYQSQLRKCEQIVYHLFQLPHL